MASGAHPSVLHLTRPLNEKTKAFKTALTVDEIRRVGRFLSLTSHDGGYRVVIVDPADDMNTNAANALLKNLEEPPSRTLFVLIAHSLGRLLPTIRSRCQIVRLPAARRTTNCWRRLGLSARIAGTRRCATRCWRAPAAARAAAIMLADYGGVEIAEAHGQARGRAAIRPASETHRLADVVGGRDQAIPFGIFNAMRSTFWRGLRAGCRTWRHAAAPTGFPRPGSDSRIAIAETETYNLDRKQHVLSMITRLNDTLRM